MTLKWKRTAAAVLLSSALISSSIPAYAADAGTLSIQALTSYHLTDVLDVEIKSVLNEKTDGGTRLGAVIRLKNNGSKLTRVPEYELRFKTSDGVEYTLQPSASNPRSVQAKTKQELSYMTVIDRNDSFDITDVSWVDVDVYVYPKKETEILSVAAPTSTWQGSDTEIKDAGALKKWGEAFTIPALTSPLTFTPVALSKDFSGQTPTAVVQLLVANDTDSRETIPDFSIDGKDSSKIYSGKRVEQGAIVLEPGEKRYLTYAIPVDLDTELASLNVLTTEKFASAPGSAIQYNVGRLNIVLPAEGLESIVTQGDYELGKPFVFDELNELVSSDMEVSMVELNVHEGEGDGYKTAVAKFKLTNNGERPLPIPAFQTDLVSTDGFSYAGTRQNVLSQRIMPNTAYTVAYSFVMPPSETNEKLTLKLTDAQTAAPYKTSIAAYTVALDTEKPDPDVIKMYPFNLAVKDWRMVSTFTVQRTYGYKLKLWLDITRSEQVITDNGFSKIQFEIADSFGRVISTKTLNMVGQNRLMSGENSINFDAVTEQLEYPLTVNMYELISTPNGDVKRLVANYKQ